MQIGVGRGPCDGPKPAEELFGRVTWAKGIQQFAGRAGELRGSARPAPIDHLARHPAPGLGRPRHPGRDIERGQCRSRGRAFHQYQQQREQLARAGALCQLRGQA